MTAEDALGSTHIGRYTMEGSGQIDLLSGGLVWAGGIVTAANGDQLFWYTEVMDAMTIIGGTGRFEGATGGFTSVTGPQEITFDDGTMILKYTFTNTGTITY